MMSVSDNSSQEKLFQGSLFKTAACLLHTIVYHWSFKYFGAELAFYFIFYKFVSSKETAMQLT